MIKDIFEILDSLAYIGCLFLLMVTGIFDERPENRVICFALIIIMNGVAKIKSNYHD